MEIGSVKLDSLTLASTQGYEQAIQLSILHIRLNETSGCYCAYTIRKLSMNTLLPTVPLVKTSSKVSAAEVLCCCLETWRTRGSPSNVSLYLDCPGFHSSAKQVTQILMRRLGLLLTGTRAHWQKRGSARQLGLQTFCLAGDYLTSCPY